ncbi:MAG: hypothetical protein NTX58_14315 [Actinobacteria bacterium]|nr:hypothetical protein [Actinomycetota bacterium]
MSQNSSTQSHSTTTGLAALLRYAATQHGVISAAEAANFDVSRAQLRSGTRRGDWLTPHSGVLISAAAPATWMQRCMVATQRSGGLISHRAAARLHGLDGFHGAESGTRGALGGGGGSRVGRGGSGGSGSSAGRSRGSNSGGRGSSISGGRGGDGESGLIELTVPDSRFRAIGDFLVHRTCVLDPEDCTVIRGIAVTSIARTLADLGAVVSDDRVEQALDDAIRRGYSLRWITETLDRVDRPGPSGCASLRRVLARPDRQGPIPDSMFERSMERMAVAGGMPQPERQFRVYDGLGSTHGGLGVLVAQLDAAWPAAKLGVEAHSARWHDGNRRGRADQRRDNRLAGLGWELLYLSWWDLQHPATFQSDLTATTRMILVDYRPESSELGRVEQGWAELSRVELRWAGLSSGGQRVERELADCAKWHDNCSALRQHVGSSTR